MGLDITAYRGLTKAQPGEGVHPRYAEEADDDNGWFRLYVESGFAGRADEIEDRAIYRAADRFDFPAGPYSGYSEWRDALAELAGYPTAPHPSSYRLGQSSHAASVWADPKPGPFMELIHFSDCEGVIGTAVSAKLAKDFVAFQDKADAHPNAHFRAKYALWRKAFEMASDRGAVRFH